MGRRWKLGLVDQRSRAMSGKGVSAFNEKNKIQNQIQTKINHFSLTVYSDRNGFAVFCKRHITDYRQGHVRNPKITEKSGKNELSQCLCVVTAGRRTATINEKNGNHVDHCEHRQK